MTEPYYGERRSDVDRLLEDPEAEYAAEAGDDPVLAEAWKQLKYTVEQLEQLELRHQTREAEIVRLRERERELLESVDALKSDLQETQLARAAEAASYAEELQVLLGAARVLNDAASVLLGGEDVATDPI
jgi:flagellar biosynthesis/type III secretory pathway chaperone